MTVCGGEFTLNTLTVLEGRFAARQRPTLRGPTGDNDGLASG